VAREVALRRGVGAELSTALQTVALLEKVLARERAERAAAERSACEEREVVVWREADDRMAGLSSMLSAGMVRWVTKADEAEAKRAAAQRECESLRAENRALLERLDQRRKRFDVGALRVL